MSRGHVSDAPSSIHLQLLGCTLATVVIVVAWAKAVPWLGLALAAVTSLLGGNWGPYIFLVVAGVGVGYVLIDPPAFVSPQQAIRSRIRSFPSVLVRGFSMVALANVISLCFFGDPGAAQPSPGLPVRIDGRPLGSFALSLALVALIAPFVEELVFRGWFQKKLRELVPTAATVIVGAGVFAAMHMQHWHAPENLIGPFVLGVMCALIVIETGSLLFSWVLHASWNAVALSVMGSLQPFAHASGATRLIIGIIASVFVVLLVLDERRIWKVIE